MLAIAALVWLSLFSDAPMHPTVLEVTHEVLRKTGIQVSGVIRYYDGELELQHPSQIQDKDWHLTDNLYENPLRQFPEWQGTRWFRLRVRFSPELHGEALSLNVFHIGYLNIWLQDKLILHTNEALEQGNAPPLRSWRSFSVPADTGEVVLTMKLYAPMLKELDQRKVMYTGVFGAAINLPTRTFEAVSRQVRFLSLTQGFMVGFCIVLTVVHILLYLFNRKLVFNIWFALFCFFFGIVGTAGEYWYFFPDVYAMVRNSSIMQSAALTCFVFMVWYAYALLRGKVPKVILILGCASFVIASINLTGRLASYISLALVLIHGIELIRFIVVEMRRKTEGAWVIGVGIILFVFSIFAMISFEILKIQVDNYSFSLAQLPYFGFAFAMLSMSLYQSQHVARLNLNLSLKLREVRELSDKTLEQERSLREAEISRVKLEAEHQRKTDELEKARRLQLSMLPQQLPEITGYAMAASMMTATEVGGDYYDVRRISDTQMIWTLGDATGHGTEAGFVVAMTKTLFQSMPLNEDPASYLQRMSHTMKQAGMKSKFMCLGFLNIHSENISWTSAGIPAALVYQCASKSIVPLLSKGMPLGTVPSFTYVTVQHTLQPGDVVLLYSDGLTEQANQEGEQVDEQRLIDWLKGAPDTEPAALITYLSAQLDTWRNDVPLRDDVTMVVVKKTEH